MSDTQPPRTVTGEQPVIPVPAQPINFTDKATFVVDIKTIALVLGVVAGFATALYANKVFADDMKTVKENVAKLEKEKADKSSAEDREKRLREMEKFVAAQIELNKSVASLEKKRDEDDTKRDKENKEEHRQLDSKLNQLLMRK